MADLSSPSTLPQVLSSAPHIFLQPSISLHNSAIQLAIFLLDPLAAEVSWTQIERQRQNRKRKRHERDTEEEPLRLKQIHTDGLELSQVWEQARRVLEAARKEVERGVKDLQDADEAGSDVELNGEAAEKLLVVPQNKEDLSLEDASDAYDIDGQDDFEGFEEGSDDFDEEEDIMDQDDPGDLNEEDNFQPSGEFIEDPNGLNDGFFSIDDFNRHSKFLEQVDARGDPDDGTASDEEEIDWAVDPLIANPMPGAIANSNAEPDIEDEHSGDDDEGPTFGDMDLDAPEGASDQEGDTDDEDEISLDDPNDLSNANNIMYADFFAPPPAKASKKKGRPMPHNFPSKSDNPQESQIEEDDIKRTMAAVHRDIFSDEEEDEGDAADEEPTNYDLDSRRSTHERRQAALLAEIRKLEAQNVAKRSWTLSGEARANDRPLNSLLEEDLEFERAGKPVPVITQEVSEDIEAMIKRRILNREFDEVLRRRPDEILTGPLGRRGALPEVDDAKSKKGLAEMYEEEYQRRTDPNYVDPRDEKLKKEHREIEQAWKEIASQLDSLCSWHYRPQPVEMSVQVRTDAPAVGMEDARPSGVGGVGVGEASQLAPQEVYRSGQEKEKDEVVSKGGEVLKRDELTRDQKLRRRRREKERLKKAMGNAKPAVSAKKDAKKQEKQNVITGLKKGGVTVIGRKGELLDVEGNAAKRKKAAVTGGSLKL